MARAYVKYPELSKDLLKRAGRYNRCIRRLEKMEKEGKLIVIRPTSTKGFSRLEHDQQKILNLYADGYNKGLEISDKIKDYFRNSQK